MNERIDAFVMGSLLFLMVALLSMVAASVTGSPAVAIVIVAVYGIVWTAALGWIE